MSLLSMAAGARPVDPARLPQPAEARPLEEGEASRALDAFADRFAQGRFARISAHHVRAPRADRSLPWQPVLKLADNGPQLQGKARRLAWDAPEGGQASAWDTGGGHGVVIVALDDGTAGSFPIGYYSVRFTPANP